jgi:hypothetical protein
MSVVENAMGRKAGRLVVQDNTCFARPNWNYRQAVEIWQPLATCS